MISFRRMTTVDIPAGLLLCRAAGWNQLASDWDIFLRCNPEGARVLVDDDGRIIGTVTTMRYGEQFSWVGMLLVDPNERRKGLGTKLLTEATAILSKEFTIRLDATSAGREVYRQFGFNDEQTITRMQCAPFSGRYNIVELASPVNENDLDEIMVWDKQVFGADRSQLLRLMYASAAGLSLKISIGGRIVSYCFGRHGYAYLHIGPVVATTFTYAVEIMSAMLNSNQGKSILLDVKPHDPEWMEWLIHQGFTAQREFIRMYKGIRPPVGEPLSEFAIMGPEFG